jgi:hypothetical protein
MKLIPQSHGEISISNSKLAEETTNDTTEIDESSRKTTKVEIDSNFFSSCEDRKRFSIPEFSLFPQKTSLFPTFLMTLSN